MTRIRIFMAAAVIILLAISCAKKPELPGPVKQGTRLPNHWVITPAGRHIPVGDLPLNMVFSPDGKLLAVTNNGYSRHFISLISTETDTVVSELETGKSFYGLAFSPDGGTLYASGGSAEQVLAWQRNGNDFTPGTPISLKGPDAPPKMYPAGMTLSKDGQTIYVAENRGDCLAFVSLQKNQVEKHLKVGSFPYDIKVSSRSRLYVSLWGGSEVGVVDTQSGTVISRIKVGDHPNTMLFSPDEKLLYVACSNTDDIWVIDTTGDRTVETIELHPYPHAPFGSTPNGLAISSDGSTLYVANATNNDVAVVDVSPRRHNVSGHSIVTGLIPVGWYPTALAVSPDGRKLYVASGKGLTSLANPKGPNPNNPKDRTGYIGGLFNGTVSVIPVPNAGQLASYTRQAEKNNGFSEAARKFLEKERSVKAHAVPRRVGEPSLIKHVIYVIRENRTYDQVLGDMTNGNGDSTLCLFGPDVTPNYHALADKFVLMDNFYVDAEVSADGHEWSTAGIATDFVEKSWPSSYSGRGIPYPSEGEFTIAFPTSGYIWEAAARKGLTYRSYGEFIVASGQSVVVKHHALEGHYDPAYRPWDLSYPDTLRAAEFIRELREFEKQGDLPRFILLRLPNNHTNGTNPGIPTPRAMVADNDLALGKVIEALTHSRFWKDTAVFVVEDDAQNGPDHVDAHRSPALVVSPYIRRGYVDHTLYDTASMLRTMELILGLPPMSQYDAAAYPMVDCFTDHPDLTPHKVLRPSIPLDEKNTATSYGVHDSMAMDFSREDATPEIRLNEIIWKSIRGENSEMPRPIHRRSVQAEDEDDDD